MNPDLRFHLKAFSRLIYFVTDEEDRFLVQLKEAMGLNVTHAKVYNGAFGLIPLADLIGDWGTKAHSVSQDTMGIHDALIAIYKEQTLSQRKFYVITDPDRWLQDQHVQRRILNILHQIHNDVNTVKVLICVSQRRYIPEKLARYTEVVQDTGLTPDEILHIVGATCKSLDTEQPDDSAGLFKGLTSFEIQAALIQSYKKTRGVKDSKLLSSYRFRQLKKTDLVQYIDTSPYSFDQLGGAGRFKDWVRLTKPSWSEEGRNFGLEPPKGILAVGVWGTGKSLAIKALGNEWGLPVIQLEMGRLRSSAVGESEANVYRVIKIIESIAPVVIWVDEAEKSLAGGQSSAFTDAGTTSRTIGILSTWLQETNSPVCMAMTANSLKTLPVEFINRMDERWFFDLPSTEDRIDILKIHLTKRKLDPSLYNLNLLSEKAESMVGREIEQALKSALARSFFLNSTTLDEATFADELEKKPRIVKTMVDEIKETMDWVGFDPEHDDGIKARYAADPRGPDRKLKVVG
jgi:AAA+ superfamily predicted ATPase